MKTHYLSKSEKSTSKVCFYLCFDRFQRFFNSKTVDFPCYVDVDLSVKNHYFFEPQNVDLSGCRLKCESTVSLVGQIRGKYWLGPQRGLECSVAFIDTKNGILTKLYIEMLHQLCSQILFFHRNIFEKQK